MEEQFKRLALAVATGVEASAALIIAAGAVEGVLGAGRTFFIPRPRS